MSFSSIVVCEQQIRQRIRPGRVWSHSLILLFWWLMNLLSSLAHGHQLDSSVRRSVCVRACTDWSNWNSTGSVWHISQWQIAAKQMQHHLYLSPRQPPNWIENLAKVFITVVTVVGPNQTANYFVSRSWEGLVGLDSLLQLTFSDTHTRSGNNH